MKEINLTQGKKSIVDDFMYEFVNGFKWHYCKGYALKWIKINKKPFAIYMHHFISGKPLNGLVIDHINGNPLDNRIENMRIVTISQNGLNRGKTKSKTSKYKGVYYHPQRKSWRPIVVVNKKKYFLGYYKDEKDAAIAYDKKHKELAREYSKTNF